MSEQEQQQLRCNNRGGRRDGCGRKPGVKTQPIRLPIWLIEQLSQQGDARQLLIDACIKQYSLNSPCSGDTHE